MYLKIPVRLIIWNGVSTTLTSGAASFNHFIQVLQMIETELRHLAQQLSFFLHRGSTWGEAILWRGYAAPANGYCAFVLTSSLLQGDSCSKIQNIRGVTY